MTLSGPGFCFWDWAVLGFCGVFFWVGGRQNLFQYVKTHMHTCTHTQNISLLTCFHCLHLRAFVTVTFGSHLMCVARLAPLSRIPLLFSWGFFQASPHCATEPSCQSFSSFPLSIVSIYLFSIHSIHSYFKSLFFYYWDFSPHYFFLSFSLCLFFCHFLLPCIKHALYL